MRGTEYHQVDLVQQSMLGNQPRVSGDVVVGAHHRSGANCEQFS